MSLGQRLFDLRREKHLSQEEVANILNVTRQTVSKWETDQSTPDFDKIVPLCELYEISPNELFGREEERPAGVNESCMDLPEEVTKDTFYDNENNFDVFVQDDAAIKQKKAIAIAISVIIYIIACAWIMVAIPVLKINPIVASAVFLLIAAIGVGIDIFAGIVYKVKKEDGEALTADKKLEKQIKDVIAAIVLVLYLLISFITHAWHITWIIWVIYGLVAEIVNLVFLVKGNKNEKK